MIWVIGLAALSLGLLPFVGMFVDSRGSRISMLIGLALIGGPLTLLWVARTGPVSFLIITSGVVGSTMGTFIPVATAINHWFLDRRATAIALLLFGGEVLSWGVSRRPWPVDRWVLVGHGAVILVVVLPLAWLVRDRPESHGQFPDGSETARAEPVPDFSVREALGSRAFWLLTLASVCMAAVSGIMALAPASLVPDRASDAVQFAGFRNIQKVTMLAFLLVGGYLGDRIPIRYALCMFALLHLLSAVALVVGDSVGMLWLSAALLGMGAGGEAALSVAAVGAYFGRRRFATIIGIQMVIVWPLIAVMHPGAFWLNNFDASGFLPVDAAAALAGLAMVAYLVAGEPRLAPSQPNVLSEEN